MRIEQVEAAPRLSTREKRAAGAVAPAHSSNPNMLGLNCLEVPAQAGQRKLAARKYALCLHENVCGCALSVEEGYKSTMCTRTNT